MLELSDKNVKATKKKATRNMFKPNEKTECLNKETKSQQRNRRYNKNNQREFLELENRKSDIKVSLSVLNS